MVAGGAQWTNFPGDPADNHSWWAITSGDTTDQTTEAQHIYINSPYWAQPVYGWDAYSWVQVQTFIGHGLYTNNSQGNPWMTEEGSYSYQNWPNPKAPSTPPNMVQGDVYAYNWSGEARSGASHASIQVAGSPGSPVPDQNSGDSNYTGDLVDPHTTNRYHVIWSLRPVNQNNWQSTTIFLFHINGGD